ncbi:hypothetical protein [Streptomyces sp. NPDC003832]
MSADRETNLDMTHRDIALMLAEAADEVEIGIAPTQAVIRGGRRRRARRWAVATVTALVIAGTTGAVAVAGLPGTGGDRGATVANAPAGLLEPRSIVVAMGLEAGTAWNVTVDLWTAPEDGEQARAQLAAMDERGMRPDGVDTASQLIYRNAYFVIRTYGDAREEIMQNVVNPYERYPVGSVEVVPLDPEAPDPEDPERLVVGQAVKDSLGVACIWTDGTRTETRRMGEGNMIGSDGAVFASVEGSPVNWFVCLAPKGKTYEDSTLMAPLPAK